MDAEIFNFFPVNFAKMGVSPKVRIFDEIFPTEKKIFPTIF